MENLVDAIKEGEIVRIPETVAKAEDLFILRNVESFEKNKVEKNPYQDAKTKQFEKSRDFKKPSFFESWKRGEDYKRNNVINELVPNFHWEIIKKRRTKNLSRQQLSAKSGISEEDLKVIELGRLPIDDFIYISKIEEILGISLRKNKSESITLADLQKKKENSQTKEKVEKKEKIFTGGDIEIIE